MDYVIQVTDLVKSFGKETVLHHINMNFAPGKIHGIIGRNGSGKTMLMKCICGFIPVTSGKVTVFGKVIGKDVDIPDNIGAIIETPGFLPEYGAYRNLKFLADITGRASKEKIRNAMQSVGYAAATGIGTGDHGRSRPADSGRTDEWIGQRRRTGYAKIPAPSKGTGENNSFGISFGGRHFCAVRYRL